MTARIGRECKKATGVVARRDAIEAIQEIDLGDMIMEDIG